MKKQKEKEPIIPVAINDEDLYINKKQLMKLIDRTSPASVTKFVRDNNLHVDARGGKRRYLRNEVHAAIQSNMVQMGI